MAGIERKQWRIHPEVIKFWERRGKKIRCYGEYWQYHGEEVGGSTYFYELEQPQVGISTGDFNVIAHDHRDKMLYRLDGVDYSETQILKLLKLKAFI